METKELLETGIMLAKKGKYAEALKLFDQDLCVTQNPTAMSYYALCLLKVEDNYEKAVALSLMAAEKEFYNPEIFLNLGRIFLVKNQKQFAIKAFKRGLKFDQGDEAILREIKRLGVRKKPLLSFLPRENTANRILGRIVRGTRNTDPFLI